VYVSRRRVANRACAPELSNRVQRCPAAPYLRRDHIRQDQIGSVIVNHDCVRLALAPQRRRSVSYPRLRWRTSRAKTPPKGPPERSRGHAQRYSKISNQHGDRASHLLQPPQSLGGARRSAPTHPAEPLLGREISRARRGSVLYAAFCFRLMPWRRRNVSLVTRSRSAIALRSPVDVVRLDRVAPGHGGLAASGGDGEALAGGDTEGGDGAYLAVAVVRTRRSAHRRSGHE